MIVIIISWIILYFIFSAFGGMIALAWNKLTNQENTLSPFDVFWLGICSVGIILLYVSLIAPLNIWVFATIASIATLYYIWDWRVLLNSFIYIKEWVSKYSWLEKLLFMLVFFAVLIYSLSTPTMYDEGLYHLQTMQWNEKFKAVLGLGNLHGRLGFNSSFLLLSTAFNYATSQSLVFFSINSLSLLIFSFWIVDKIIELRKSVQSIMLIVILLLSLFSLGTNVSSTSTDILPSILIIYLLTNWVMTNNFVSKKPLLLAVVAMFCITLKLSAAIIILAALYCIFILYKEGRKKEAGLLFLVGIIIALPWISRFIILTGYLLYPFPSIDIFSFDWKIPLEMTALEKDSAYAWARIPDREIYDVLKLGFTEWFPIWLQRLSFYNLTLYTLALLSPLIMAFAKAQKQYIVPYVIAVVGVVYGLLTAPDFRFGFGYIISAATIPFILLSFKIEWKWVAKMTKLTQGEVAILLIAILYIAVSQVNTYQPLSDRSLQSLIVKPQDVDLMQKRSKVSFENYKLNNTTIFVPIGTNQCFDQTIPCVPSFTNNIEMRGDDIQDGFRIKNK